MPNLPTPPKKPATSGWSRGGGKTSFYALRAWKKLRALHLSESPLCVACQYVGTLTDCTRGGHIDHIVRIEAGGAPLDQRNLWTLCRDHHARKTAKERHGFRVQAVGPEGERIPAAGAIENLKKEIA